MASLELMKEKILDMATLLTNNSNLDMDRVRSKIVCRRQRVVSQIVPLAFVNGDGHLGLGASVHLDQYSGARFDLNAIFGDGERGNGTSGDDGFYLDLLAGFVGHLFVDGIDHDLWCGWKVKDIKRYFNNMGGNFVFVF